MFKLQFCSNFLKVYPFYQVRNICLDPIGHLIRIDNICDVTLIVRVENIFITSPSMIFITKYSSIIFYICLFIIIMNMNISCDNMPYHNIVSIINNNKKESFDFPLYFSYIRR